MPETEKALSKEAMEAAQDVYRRLIRQPVSAMGEALNEDVIAAALEAFAAPWVKAAVDQQKLGMSWMDKAKNGEADRDTLRARNVALVEAFSALITRLDVVHADPRYQGIWVSAMVHGIKYDEPTYTDQLAAARAALAADAKAGEDR